MWALRRATPNSERPLVQFDAELRSGGLLGSEVGTDVTISPDGIT
jgi:hypothetical protein